MMSLGLESNRKIVAFLSDPGNYPEATPEVAHVETHISHVFLCEHFVYKIKKPVNFGFLDFSTLRKRRFYCTREVLLNGRLAPHIYLGAVAIFGKGDAYSFSPQRRSRPVEYAVRMKRIALDCLLYNLIEEGRPLYGELDEVGRALARFHRGAAIDRGKRYGDLGTVGSATRENFQQVGPFRGVMLDDGVYETLIRYTDDFLAGQSSRFAQRKRDGLVRDGHGDLHCQHICLEHPPVIFDCIEFNDAFRIIDVLEDVAFLLMDLEFRGRFDLSSGLEKAYFNHWQDAYDEDLLRFYKIYRAVVRGKVECFSARDLVDGAAIQKSALRARDYFDLAHHYVSQYKSPFNPIVFMGLSGSGKSTIARDFSPDAVIVRSDDIRKEMTEIGGGRHAYAPYGEGIYEPETTGRVYCALLDRTVRHSRAGKRVIVDATYLKAGLRQDFYATCMANGLNPFFVHCVAGEEVLRQRIKGRMEEGTDVSDAHLGILEAQLRHREEPEELPSYRVLRINTEDALHNIVRALKEFL
jgi:uncharacterized protein